MTSGPVAQPVPTHEHVAERQTLVKLRGGVPFEVEREVCSVCLQVLSERALRRVLV